jgi:hypothetical protein
VVTIDHAFGSTTIEACQRIAPPTMATLRCPGALSVGAISMIAWSALGEDELSTGVPAIVPGADQVGGHPPSSTAAS